MRDFAKGIGSDIGVGLGLDFSGCADHRGDVPALRFSGLYRDDALAALVHCKSNNDEQHESRAYANRHFLPRLHGSLSHLERNNVRFLNPQFRFAVL